MAPAHLTAPVTSEKHRVLRRILVEKGNLVAQQETRHLPSKRLVGIPRVVDNENQDAVSDRSTPRKTMTEKGVWAPQWYL